MPEAVAQQAPEPKPEAAPDKPTPEVKRKRFPRPLFPRFRRKAHQRLFYASKDYVEQLRTVHFALLSVSAGLLLLILSAKPYNARKAALQLEAIVRLKELWTPQGLKSNAHGHHYNNIGHTGSQPYFLPTSENHSQLFVTIADPGSRPALFMVEPLKATQFLWIVEPFITFPDNIGDLETWWDDFGQTFHTYIDWDTVTIAKDCAAFWEEDRIHRVKLKQCSVSYSQPALVYRSQPASMSLNFIGVSLIQDRVTGRMDFFQAKDVPRTRAIVNGKYVIIAFDMGSFTGFTVSRSDLIQSVLAARDGNFEESFPDLYRATSGESKTLDLASILKHLQAESSSSEVFEAFGLKIPAKQVTSCGMVVIICIQLYLFVYLRGLKSPLEASDESWNAGWFAANDALLPRSIFFVTVFVLPIITVILLSQHALDQRVQQAGLTWSWHFVTSKSFLGFMRDFKAVPFLILGCCASLVLGYLNWSNRPRIRLEPAQSRSQLFE